MGSNEETLLTCELNVRLVQQRTVHAGGRSVLFFFLQTTIRPRANTATTAIYSCGEAYHLTMGECQL